MSHTINATAFDPDDEQYPDIEIYLKPLSIEALGAWLGEQFGQVVVFQPAGRLQHRARLTRDGNDIALLVVEKVANGFASLWFDSAATPWARDVDCARAAAAALQVESRCSLGSWQPGDEPDRFYRILPDGSEEAFTWPDKG
ncbi:hypothetical protein [Cobetia sp. L2A1]|uniref:hypothetical protein n=1 Tax=Cobetia sp. L2A1 TaxID=2686360 RepID=UPI00131CACD9|nr:hypothetical protein [Cobetia sp. L2A1]